MGTIYPQEFEDLRKHGMTILHSLDNGELGISAQSESIQQTRMKSFFWQNFLHWGRPGGSRESSFEGYLPNGGCCRT